MAEIARNDVGLRIVVGPRTRVGRAVASSSSVPLALVSRGDDDAKALADLGLGDQSIDLADVASAVLCSAGSVDVVLCALGPVHPDPIDPQRDRAAVTRDLGLLADTLDAARGRTVRVVLISSVLALAPAEDRRYYGGWKNLVEAEVQAIVAAHPGVSLDVLYPGRLSTSRGPGLHASHGTVADRVEDVLSGKPVGRLVGLDARLWLLVRAVKVAMGALRPGRSRIDATSLPAVAPADPPSSQGEAR